MIILEDFIYERQANDYLVQIRIATNPHLKKEDQQAFINELMARRRQVGGIKEEKIDRAALDRLRKTLKNESRSKIKVK